jgi:glutamate N-acetyltransferase/amino-acid N-acetyltransferase
MTVVRVSMADVDGSVSAPAGFRAAGISCGIKKSGSPDLALIVSDAPASSAAVFTTNKAQAAPVLVSKARLAASAGHARVIVINSGCANACTGPEGMGTAEAMADTAARAVGADRAQALVASTGVIGVALNRGVVLGGIDTAFAALAEDGGAAAARAIMTTDPFPKEAAIEVTTPSGRFRVGGIAKGSGMIEPLMASLQAPPHATMLAVVTTDAQAPPALLQRALTAATELTFNAITVDGECSTNDCVFALANGASGVAVGEGDTAMVDIFVEALRLVCERLAIGIVRGGEGATKLVTIDVSGGRSDAEAKQAARAIANSPLVKTAVHGADPNWGRLVAVAGRAGVDFDLERARVQIGEVELFAGGRPFDERAPLASAHLQGTDVSLRVDLGTGGAGAARMWTCDLSAEYVKINAEYRT